MYKNRISSRNTCPGHFLDISRIISSVFGHILGICCGVFAMMCMWRVFDSSSVALRLVRPLPSALPRALTIRCVTLHMMGAFFGKAERPIKVC